MLLHDSRQGLICSAWAQTDLLSRVQSGMAHTEVIDSLRTELSRISAALTSFLPPFSWTALAMVCPASTAASPTSLTVASRSTCARVAHEYDDREGVRETACGRR